MRKVSQVTTAIRYNLRFVIDESDVAIRFWSFIRSTIILLYSSEFWEPRNNLKSGLKSRTPIQQSIFAITCAGQLLRHVCSPPWYRHFSPSRATSVAISTPEKCCVPRFDSSAKIWICIWAGMSCNLYSGLLCEIFWIHLCGLGACGKIEEI